MRNILIGALLFCVFAVWVAPSEARKRKDQPNSNPAIAFSRDGDLMIMDADGSNVRRVKRKAKANSPSWSPDGKKLAYHTGQSASEYALYTIDLDGRNRRKLFSGSVAASAWSPVPAPDGEYKIAFCSNGDLCVINTDGRGFQNLTTVITGNYTDMAWSPDATQLIATGPKNVKLLSLDADSSGGVAITEKVHGITDATGSPLPAIIQASGFNSYSNPDWSRDGKRIALSVYAEGSSAADTDVDLWVIDLADPGNPVQITSTPGNSAWESYPHWSPDDSRIVCTRVGSDIQEREIVTMDADGSGVTKLISGNVYTAEWRR